MVRRTQAENIANRLAGNEPLGLMESVNEHRNRCSDVLNQEVVDYQKRC